ncbi:MAG: glycosyltransferase [Phycisphaerales bacterium]|nr:glycosyltransferase [Phycisphaerales bacterium]
MLSVSIITPTFNHAHRLREAVDSVLEQNYSQLEYRVIDGGSADQTQALLQQYTGRLAWISEPDRGQTDAIIKGFKQSCGEILGWLNADDRYRTGAIATAAQYFSDHPQVMLIYGDACFIDSHGRQLGPCSQVEPFNYQRLLNISDFIVQPATFFRRSAYEAVGGLDAGLSWAMDYDLWLKIAKRFPVAYVPRVFADYRWDGGNKTATGGMSRLNEVEQVARRHGGKGLPSYFALEAAAMRANEVVEAIRQGSAIQAIKSAKSAAGHLLSTRTLGTLAERSTWRILETRRKIRRRASLLG